MGMKKKEINYQLLIRRICLIVLDIICIIAASILALLTRFEFDFSQIPKEFLKVIYKYGPFTIVITLIIFSLFRIYSSLWEYAGIEEVFSLIAACLAAAVAKIVIILFTWSVMPRSWYVLDTIYLMILIGAINPKNRYINLTGVGANNNNRDFYIKSLTIGGQKEELYDDEDLDSIGYAFRRAGNPEKKNVNLHLSKEILEKIKEEKE